MREAWEKRIEFPYPNEYKNIKEYVKQGLEIDEYYLSIKRDLIRKYSIYNQKDNSIKSIKQGMSHRDYEASAYIFQSGLLAMFNPENSVFSFKIKNLDEIILKPEYAIILLTDSIAKREAYLFYESEEHMSIVCSLALYMLKAYKSGLKKMELNQSEIHELAFALGLYYAGEEREDNENTDVRKIVQDLIEYEELAAKATNNENTKIVQYEYVEMLQEIKGYYLCETDNALSDEELECIGIEEERVLHSKNNIEKKSQEYYKVLIFKYQLAGLINFWLIDCCNEIINSVAYEYSHAISTVKSRMDQNEDDEDRIKNICVKELKNKLDGLGRQEVKKRSYIEYIIHRADECSKMIADITELVQAQCKDDLQKDRKKTKTKVIEYINDILKEDLTLAVINYNKGTRIEVPGYLHPIFTGIQKYYQSKPYYFGKRNTKRKLELLIPVSDNSIENNSLWNDFVKILNYLDFERGRLQEKNLINKVLPEERKKIYTDYWTFCFCSIYEIYQSEMFGVQSNNIKSIDEKIKLWRNNHGESEYALERIWGFALLDYEEKTIQQYIEKCAQDIIDSNSIEVLRQGLKKMEIKNTLSQECTKNEIVNILLDVFFTIDRKRIYREIEEYDGVYQRLCIANKKLPQYVCKELKEAFNDSEEIELLTDKIVYDLREEGENKKEKKDYINIERVMLTLLGKKRVSELQVEYYAPYDDFYDSILQYLYDNLNMSVSSEYKFYENKIKNIAKGYMDEQTDIKRKIMEYLLVMHEKEYRVSGLEI